MSQSKKSSVASFFSATKKKTKDALKRMDVALMSSLMDYERQLVFSRAAGIYMDEFSHVSRTALAELVPVADTIKFLKSYARTHGDLKAAIPDEQWMREVLVDEEGEKAPVWMQRQLFLHAMLRYDPRLYDYFSDEDRKLMKEWVTVEKVPKIDPDPLRGLI